MKASANPRNHWTSLYVLVNIVGAAIMYFSGTMIGDLSGNSLYSEGALFAAVSLVCASYIIMLGPVFNLVSKIKVTKSNFGGDRETVGQRIGIVLVFLQIGFMAFNLVTGVNIAGANTTRTNNPLSILWVMVPVDALFFVYYGFHRENRYFYPNLIIWIISNMARGWSGMFLFVAFFEWCRAYRNNKISWRVVFSLAVIGTLLYPVLINLKWIFRLSATSSISIDSVITTFANNFSSDDLLNIVGAGIEQVIGRLQVTSLVVEVIRLRDFVHNEFLTGQFTPFWLEGLHGIFVQKSLLNERFLPIGVAFTQYGDFSWQSDAVGDWNTNIGYVGWFFIAPYLIPLYLLYTIFLGFIAIFLAKLIGWSDSVKDMVWLAWLVYLLPPWFATFVTVIQALVIFLVMNFIFSGYKKYADYSSC